MALTKPLSEQYAVQDISLKTKYRRYTRSSSFVMALLFTILCGAVAVVLGYFINYFAKGHFVHSTQAIIDSEIKYIDTLGKVPSAQDSQNNPERLYVLLDSNGRLPSNFPQPAQVLAEGLLVFDIPDIDTQNTHISDTHKRFAARIHTMDNGQKMLVGTDITDIADDFDFMQWIGIASIVFVVIVVFVSYLISIFVVNGTNKIANTAYDIMRTGDLSQRVAVKSRWDDLSHVANTLNMLFDRIEALMRGVRQISDNIAHDLRTPLTRMRSCIEGLQKQDPSNPAYTALLSEAEHTLSTFSALLRISRIETEQQRSQFNQLYIDKLLQDVIEFYEPLYEGKDITLTKRLEHISFNGDRDLLFQAYANIVDNAIKYTPNGGCIDVSIQKRHARIVVSINNNGDSILEDELVKIFERFYRVDKSRHQSGAGLGLSLVAAVINLHGGEVVAQNVNSGVEIITTFNA